MIDIRSTKDVARLFFIYSREMKVAMVFTAVVIVLGAFLLPSRYVSDARLLVKPGGVDTTLPMTTTQQTAALAPVSQSVFVTNEQHILTSQAVVNRVASEVIKAQLEAKPPSSWWKRFKQTLNGYKDSVINFTRTVLVSINVVDPTTKPERLARNLLKHMTVGPVKDSSLMQINFSWSDPQLAREILHLWINEYMDYRQHALSNPTHLYDFYREQADKQNAYIEQLQSELMNLQKGTSGIKVANRIQNLTKRLQTLRTEREKAVTNLAASTEGLKRASKILTDMPSYLVNETITGLNPSVQDLEERRNALEVKKYQLLRVYKDTAPPVLNITSAISLLDKQIADANFQVKLSEKNKLNSTKEKITSDVANYKIAIRVENAKISSLDEQINKLISERAQAIGVEPHAQELERKLLSAEKNYALYASHMEEARITRELNKSSISNIAIVEPATLNPSRVFPKTLYALLAIIPASILVGLLVIYLSSLFDRRIHDGGLVEKTLGVPLWVTIPDLNSNAPNFVFSSAISRLAAMLQKNEIDLKGLTVALASSVQGEGVTFVADALAEQLQQNGFKTLRNSSEANQPGQVNILDCSAVLQDKSALSELARADIILLVLEAGVTTTPRVTETIRVLDMAFKRADGVIVNKRRFEIPEKILRYFNKLALNPLGSDEKSHS